MGIECSPPDLISLSSCSVCSHQHFPWVFPLCLSHFWGLVALYLSFDVFFCAWSGRVNAACKLGTCTNIKFPKIVERRECKGQETGPSNAQKPAQCPTDQGGNDEILILSQDAPPKKIHRKCVSTGECRKIALSTNVSRTYYLLYGMTNAIWQSPNIYGQRSQLQNRGSSKVSSRSCTIQMFMPKCRVMQLRDKISAV